MYVGGTSVSKLTFLVIVYLKSSAANNHLLVIIPTLETFYRPFRLLYKWILTRKCICVWCAFNLATLPADKLSHCKVQA